MISPRFIKIAASGFAIGLTLTGGHAGQSAAVQSGTELQQIQIAAKSAAKATTALADGNAKAAVEAAENAVSYQPRDPQYRLLLGQAYLSAGRFAAAETSFSDVLTLLPDNARAALNLALAEIALGKRDAARATLTDYADRLSPSDFGLASALAGDVQGGVRILESAIRGGSTDAKTRQNLALSYAMAGNWAAARAMAMQDLAPEDVNNRIGQWASFVQSQTSFDQVASLLGVKPVSDAGQPVNLALNAVPAETTATAMAAPPADVAMAPVTVSAPIAPTAAFETAAVMPAPIPAAQVFPQAPKQVIVPASRPAAQFSTARTQRSVEAGKFVVQLGAYQNAAVSKDAWKRLAPRYGLNNFDPANATARVRGANFVRLSVGGFVSRSEAAGVCVRIRNNGGSCFVRGLLNDAPAYWVGRGMPKSARPTRLASR